jgi:hypothetical protein
MPRGALPFFDKGPKLIQLAFFQMVITDQVLTDPLAMCGSLPQNPRHCVLVQIEDARTGPYAIAFSQRFKHPIDRFFIGVKTSKDALVTRAEFTLAFQTTIFGRTMWPVVTNQFEICRNGLATVGAVQKQGRFHNIASFEKLVGRASYALSTLSNGQDAQCMKRTH